MQLPPGDRPGGLDRFLGELGITAGDNEADLAHVRVVGVHEAREGELVTVRSEAHQPRRGFRRASGHGHHRPIDARDRRGDSHAAMSERWCGAGIPVSTRWFGLTVSFVSGADLDGLPAATSQSRRSLTSVGLLTLGPFADVADGPVPLDVDRGVCAPATGRRAVAERALRHHRLRATHEGEAQPSPAVSATSQDDAPGTCVSPGWKPFSLPSIRTTAAIASRSESIGGATSSGPGAGISP